ncbi:hypothetical protein ACSSS7_008421 [Eimeria intestinalis]
MGEADADLMLVQEIDAKQGREPHACDDKERRGGFEGTQEHFQGDAAHNTEVVIGDTQDGALLERPRGITGSRVRGSRGAPAWWQVEGWGVSGAGAGAVAALGASASALAAHVRCPWVGSPKKKQGPSERGRRTGLRGRGAAGGRRREGGPRALAVAGGGGQGVPTVSLGQRKVRGVFASGGSGAMAAVRRYGDERAARHA